MRGSMEIYPKTAAERAMKLQEVVLRATSGKIKCIRPAKYTVDGVWGGRIGYFALLAA